MLSADIKPRAIDHLLTRDKAAHQLIYLDFNFNVINSEGFADLGASILGTAHLPVVSCNAGCLKVGY